MPHLLDLISDYRSVKNDYDSEPLTILPILQSAERKVFDRMGGFKDPQIAAALFHTYTDTLTPSYLSVQLPAIPLLDPPPTVIVDGDQYRIYDMREFAQLSSTVGNTPAATINGQSIVMAHRGSFKSGTKALTIVYSHMPRPLFLYGGIEVVAATTEYAPKGFKTYTIQFPATGITVAYKELEGAILSIQRDEVYRDDYVITAHNTGTLTSVQVNPSLVTTVEYPGSVCTVPNAFLATIHRTSDLPETLHSKIVEAAVYGIPPEAKK
jgi:hypothetical protein